MSVEMITAIFKPHALNIHCGLPNHVGDKSIHYNDAKITPQQTRAREGPEPKFCLYTIILFVKVKLFL